MARQRYTSTSPTFSNDFMFQAPWELAMNALQFNEKQVDTIYDQAHLLGDTASNINFLEADRANVEAEKEAINSQISEVTNALASDPTQWKKQMPRIRQISQSLQNNMRTGNLSKIQGSYNAYQNFVKNYEDLRKKDPQEFDKVSQYYLNQWRSSNEKGSLSSIFSPGAVYAPKSLSDKEFVDILKDFKADEFTTLNGLYKIDNKVVTKDQVAKAALNLATSNPDFANFIRQRQMIGDESYRTPMYLAIDNATGKILTPQESEERDNAFSARALEIEKIYSDPNERAKYTPQQLEAMKAELIPSYTTQLNPTNAIAQQANALGNVYSFKSQKITGNEPAIMMYKEGQATARNNATIAAANARQDKQIAATAAENEKNRAHDIEKIKLNAELNPKSEKGKGTGKKGEKIEDLITLSGTSFFPTTGTTMAQDREILGGQAGTSYDKMIVASKVATMADASSAAALQKSGNRNDKDVRGIVDFVAKGLKSNNTEVSRLVEAKDAEGLAKLYFQKTQPQEAQRQSSNKVGAFFEAIGRAGSPGAPIQGAKTPALDNYQGASANFDALFGKVRGALETYTKDYEARNQRLSAPKAEVDFFGINTRSPETRQLQNDMNINIGDYQFYKTDDLINPVENVSDVKLQNITGSYGGMPVSFIVKDSKGVTLKAVPNSKRAQSNLEYISQNSSKIVSPADSAKTNVYFGNGGKIANLATAFDYTATVGDNKQVVPIQTSTGKELKITKSLVNGQPDKLKITIQYQGAAPKEAIVDPRTISDVNQNSVIIQMLDKMSKENNFNYNLR